MKKIPLITSVVVGLIFTGCINDEIVDQKPEELSNKQIMQRLNITDAQIWNSLATQSINIEELEQSDNLKSAQKIQEYPKGEDYYFTLFEDLYPSEGDYDFNDVLLRTKLGLEKKGNNINGYLNTKLINRGGSLDTQIGIMFYEVSGKRYTRIAYNKIKVNGQSLGNGPWMTNLGQYKVNDEWTIEFEFENKSANLWVCYFIKTDAEIMTSGFASTDTESFETPHPKYLSPYNLPWGVEIEAKSFAIPNEKALFTKAYPEFADWANSNGTKNKKWFENPDSQYTHN